MAAHIVLDGLDLPEGLIWANEFDWSPVKQTIKRSLTGANLIGSGIKVKGQRMQLSGNNQGYDTCWIERAPLLILYAKLDDNVAMSVVLDDGRTFDVKFDSTTIPIIAKAVNYFSNPDDSDRYVLSINLIII